MNTNNDDPYNMADKSMDKLLHYVCGKTKDSLDHQYAKVELKKRELQEQHRLNNEIIKQQHKMNLKISSSQNKIVIIAAIITALFGIIGVFIGTRLQPNFPESQNTQTIVRQQKRLPPARTKTPKALYQKEQGLKTEDIKKVSQQPHAINKQNR